MNTFREKSRAVDPDGIGVSMVLDIPEIPTAYETNEDFEVIKLTLTLRRISVYDALQIITDYADLRFNIRNGIIHISPSAPDASTDEIPFGLKKVVDDDNPLGLEKAVRRRLFRTGKALREAAWECEIFLHREGHWPASIEELYRNFPARYGNDPFSTDRLRMAIAGESTPGVRIWSVGPDRDWDDGRQIEVADPALDGDIGIEISRKAERWLASETIAFYLAPPTALYYLPPQQPEGDPPVFPAADEQYVWGKTVDGLQAALELVPEREAYILGEAIEVQYRIRNACRRKLQVVSTGWRQSDRLTVRDKSGIPVYVERRDYTGSPEIRRETLEPGQTAVFRVAPLAFVPVDQIGGPDHPVAYFMRCAPGRFMIQFQLSFPDIILTKGGTLEVPQPEDWQGRLTPGRRYIVVQASKHGVAR
jgi:hypothetical protein